MALAAWSTARKQGSPCAPLALLVAEGLALVGLAQAVVVVPPGHVGVVHLFARVSPQTLKSGLNLVNPLARLIKVSIKTQDMKEVMDVPSQEGLTVQLEVSVLYHLDPEKAGDVYRTLGTEYAEVILQPQFRSVTRGVTAQYEARALYTSERETLAEALANELRRLVQRVTITASARTAPAAAGA